MNELKLYLRQSISISFLSMISNWV